MKSGSISRIVDANSPKYSYTGSSISMVETFPYTVGEHIIEREAAQGTEGAVVAHIPRYSSQNSPVTPAGVGYHGYDTLSNIYNDASTQWSDLPDHVLTPDNITDMHPPLYPRFAQVYRQNAYVQSNSHMVFNRSFVGDYVGSVDTPFDPVFSKLAYDYAADQTTPRAGDNKISTHSTQWESGKIVQRFESTSTCL